MKFIKVGLVIASLLSPVLLYSASGGQSKDPKQQQKTEQEKKPEEEQSLKLGTSLVTVPFNVTNKQNRYINDLTKNDIEVFEDNKPQEVFSFERQTDLPITIAMLIDISLSQQYTLRDEILAGEQFFRRVLRPDKDTAAVVTFENDAELLQGLTSSLEKLQRALESVRISAAGARVGTVTGTPPINDSGAGSTAMYDAIYAVSSDLLRREAGRRVIILVTDGDDTSSRTKMKEAIERAWRSEIICYAIGIGDPYHFHIASGVLKKICDDTGGRAFFPRNREDQDVAYAKIDEDLRSQYILAYQPANDAKDGSFRTIQLRIKNQKDLTVRHRRGYFAQKES